MKKLLIGLVAVGVLLIAAILIAPSFVDWNAHKQEITAMVREATGRELVIRGNIDVTVLPSPALRVEDVRLSSIEGAVSPETRSWKLAQGVCSSCGNRLLDQSRWNSVYSPASSMTGT